MSTSYEWWQNALVGAFGPVHEDCPEPGFYRKRESKAAGYIPAAIWEEDGAMVAVLNGHRVEAGEIWTYVCNHPISEAQYHARMETGRWHDEDAAVTASLKPPPSGHNNPPADSLEDLKNSIETALAGVADYAKVTSEEAASKAQSLRSRLNDLSGDADKKRETLKRPHLEAGRAVDEAWNPLVKMAKAGADALRAAISAFETAEKRKRDAAEAERQKKIAEDAKKAAEAQATAAAAGQPAPEPPPPAPVPEPAPVMPTQIRGAYGKAASKKVIKVASVSNAILFFPNVAHDAEIVALLQKLAQKAVNAGFMPPGVTVEEKVDVR